MAKFRMVNIDFKRIENVLKFLKENNYWNSVYEHKDPLEIALTRDGIDDIFGMIIRDTELPLIYESGCGTGLTTAQICRLLSERGIDRYKLVGHDVQEILVESARSRFSRNKNVTMELRSGSDYSEIPDGSVDGIFSLNTMLPFLYTYEIIARDSQPYREYLIETSRVLKETKPLVLTYLYVPLVLVKESKIGKGIPFQIKLYTDHPCIEAFLKVLEVS